MSFQLEAVFQIFTFLPPLKWDIPLGCAPTPTWKELLQGQPEAGFIHLERLFLQQPICHPATMWNCVCREGHLPTAAVEPLEPECKALSTVGTAALIMAGLLSPPAVRPQALPTSSWMPWPMAMCQVLMMASESCWIRYSEPSWLCSYRDTSQSVISGYLGLDWGQVSEGDRETEVISPCSQELRA